MYIELADVVKKYKSQDIETIALNHLSMNIDKGEMIAITGPSGSGKSTLLNIIGGMDSLSEGKYVFNGKNISAGNLKELHKFRKENIGFVFQGFELLNQYNVYENVEMPLLVRNVKKSREKVLQYLKKLQIEELEKKYPAQLSGGQKQRVAIARALITEPEVILADEPTGALDTATSQEIVNLLKEIHKTGTTVIVVTHEDFVANNCERIIRIVDGKIKAI